jgi:hypothetical protein
MKQKRVDERQKKAIRKKLKRKRVVSSVAGGDVVTVQETINNNITNVSGVDYLEELIDVVLSDYPADGDVLTYDEVTDKWVNEQPSGGGGGLTADQEDQLELAYTRSLNQLVW